jgi:hypothetical protein
MRRRIAASVPDRQMLSKGAALMETFMVRIGEKGGGVT